MTISYDDLRSFMKANASKPLYLAKAITAWSWTSWHAFGDPTGVLVPSYEQIKNLDTTLHGACGFRRELMRTLFDEIGIKSRYVSFYDMPIQGAHVAAEYFINGKWMFFDGTFGIYFEAKSGGLPLSIEEARAQWPNVVVKHANLPGWTGQRADPATINVKTSFSNKTDSLFAHPGLPDFDGAVSGEVTSMILGAGVRIKEVGSSSRPADDGQRSVKAVYDKGSTYSWRAKQTTYDALGLKDTMHVEYDNRTSVHTDFDQGNRFDWKLKQIVVRDWYRTHTTKTTFDDGSKATVVYDYLQNQPWRTIETIHDRFGKVQSKRTVFDDKSQALEDHDTLNATALSDRWTDIGPDKSPLKSTLRYDDGRQEAIDWTAAGRISGNGALHGTAAADVIAGGPGMDHLIGGAGPDYMAGAGGNDIYYADDPADTIVEQQGEGADSVNAGVSFMLPEHVEDLYLTGDALRGVGNQLDNYLVANQKDNRLDGDRGNDVLLGKAGRDILVGGEGRDTLDGGDGADVLFGNAGADVFLWRSRTETGLAVTTADIVMDFSASAGDRLHLKLIDANAGRAGDQAFTFIGTAAFSAPGQIRFVQVAGETRLLLNTDGDSAYEGIIRMKGLHKPDASWFVL